MSFDILLAPLLKNADNAADLKAIITNSINFTLMTAAPPEEHQRHAYMVHAADLSLNGMRNPELLFHAVRTVYHEFMEESYILAKHKDLGQQVSEYIALGNNRPEFKDRTDWMKLLDLTAFDTYGATYNRQVGFANYIISTIDRLASPDSLIFKYITSNVDNNKLLFSALASAADGKEVAKEDLDANIAGIYKDFLRVVDNYGGEFLTYPPFVSEMLIANQQLNDDFFKTSNVPSYNEFDEREPRQGLVQINHVTEMILI